MAEIKSEIAFDPKSWFDGLSEAAKFTPEQRAQVEPLLTGEPATNYLRDQVLMRSDYSRRQDEIAQERKQLEQSVEAQRTEVMKYFADLQHWQTEQEAKYGTLSKEADQARARVTQLESKAREAAATYGIDANDLLPAAQSSPSSLSSLSSQPSSSSSQPSSLESNYLTAQQGRALAELGPVTAGILEDIAFDHRELTGERLTAKARREILHAAIATSRINTIDDVEPIVRQIWQEKYGIEGKRLAVSKAQQDKLVTEAYERGRREGSSAESLPIPSMNLGRPTALTVLQQKGEMPKNDHVTRAARDFEQRLARLAKSRAAQEAA
ncbi:MAG: hypothetical protein ACRD22_09895 [Terriglobia bacterium]